VPIGVAPAKKSTFATVPSESAADAVTVKDPGAVATVPFAGAVSETVGAAFEAVLTVTDTAPDVVAAPVSSVARAVRL
jgi:hypothetical protein